jgi:hypothetical protein
MNRTLARRWFGWLALAAIVAQAGLPTLHIATANAGALRAEAVLATALCSKPTLGIADKIDALLNPWKQHRSKNKHHHCDSCPQTTDAPLAMVNGASIFSVSSIAPFAIARLPEAWIASARTRVPPSRAPPIFS